MARRLELEMRRSNEGLKSIVNRALRIGLGMTDKPSRPKPFRVHRTTSASSRDRPRPN